MMVANPFKFQVMYMGLGNDCKHCIAIDKMVITTVSQSQTSRLIIDSKPKIDEHVKSLCLKANRNISVLSREAKIVDQPKWKLLYNSYMSNFRHSPIIWLFYGKTANKEINREHKRALSILLRDYDASLDESLSKIKIKLFIFRRKEIN